MSTFCTDMPPSKGLQKPLENCTRDQPGKSHRLRSIIFWFCSFGFSISFTSIYFVFKWTETLKPLLKLTTSCIRTHQRQKRMIGYPHNIRFVIVFQENGDGERSTSLSRYRQKPKVNHRFFCSFYYIYVCMCIKLLFHCQSIIIKIDKFNLICCL